MSSFKLWAALATVLAAGCASTPNQPTASGGAVPAPVAEAAERAPGAVSDRPDVLVVDTSADNPGSVVSCREMLKPASNVIRTQCMTADDWKKFERQQELWAQQLLRRMQGSGFP